MPKLGSHGRSLLSLNCLWSSFLHMALVFQLGQPVKAQPLPGFCPGKLIQTNSRGKCFLRVCLLFVFYVAWPERRKDQRSCFSLALCYLAGCLWLCGREIALSNDRWAERRGVGGCVSLLHPLVQAQRRPWHLWGKICRVELGQGPLDSDPLSLHSSLQQLNRVAKVPSGLSNSTISYLVFSYWFLRT